MSSLKQLYSDKLRTTDEAVKLVRDGDYIVVASGVSEPPAFLNALSEHRREFHGVKVCQVIPRTPVAYFDPETTENILHMAYFLSPVNRKGVQEGWSDYFPNNFGEIPRMIRDGYLKCDVATSIASPMDEDGYFSISLGPSYTMAAIETARTVILEVNPNVPYAYGNCKVHVRNVTAIVEDSTPVVETGLPQILPVHEAIGQLVAEQIPDGATIQLGYGGIPDAVVSQIKDKKDLGIHTEVFGEGLLRLVEDGIVTNRKKTFMPGKIVATFVAGTRKLYDFMDHNPNLEMHPVDFTNEPHLTGQNDNLMAINAALQIDLLGQCCSESIGTVPFSGTGGQADFVRAANRSRGGKAFIVLPSTAKNGKLSRIVPTLTPGSSVSLSKNDVNYIVTEYGVAQLRGKSAKQRAQELIAIAHPDFREELEEAARKMNVM